MKKLTSRERASQAEIGKEAYLQPDNWMLDTETTQFPGAPAGRSQELNDVTHPHLELGKTMVSIPQVRPGDQAWWHAGGFGTLLWSHHG
jgi:hypothetical protein